LYKDHEKLLPRLTIGAHFEGVVSNQSFFDNYTASLISAPAFTPLPHCKLLFLDKYRAYSYFGTGAKGIVHFSDRFDWRLEGYLFMPYRELERKGVNQTVLGKPMEKKYYMASTSLVYHTPFGPVRFGVNYYDQSPDKFHFLFNFGFYLFNKRAID
jgi:NTE family protein